MIQDSKQCIGQSSKLAKIWLSKETKKSDYFHDIRC